MLISSLHFLLTYQCTFECDHCFVWGSPFQNGVMTLQTVREVLRQAHETNSIHSIYFEGGEPFLYYPLLLRSVKLAHEMGFEVGIVSNAYWATSLEDAHLWLAPLAGKVIDLSVSSDLFHYNELMSQQALTAQQAAGELGIPCSVITIAHPEQQAVTGSGAIPPGESGVMFRGRAAEKLANKAPQNSWRMFETCPHEDLRDPGRLHVDPFGNLHLCQGLLLGNLFHTSLVELCANYDPDDHPIVGPLLGGGPRQLVEQYQLNHPETCADACQLCYLARLQLRLEYPNMLAPDQVYGG